VIGLELDCDLDLEPDRHLELVLEPDLDPDRSCPKPGPR
jgi:hypothetical protein